MGIDGDMEIKLMKTYTPIYSLDLLPSPNLHRIKLW